MSNVASLISAIANLSWPIIALIGIYLLRDQIKSLIARSSEVEIELLGTKMKVSSKVKEVLVQPILTEMEDILLSLSHQEKEYFRKIYATNKESGEYRLTEDFNRDTDEHEILRTLRKRHLIRPVDGGKWIAPKRIAITSFGELLIKLKGKELLTMKAG